VPDSPTRLPEPLRTAGHQSAARLRSGRLRPSKSDALTGMIMGIVSVVALCGCYGFPFNHPGIVFSLVGLSQIKKAGALHWPGMAMTGLALSIFSVVIVIVLIAVFGLFFFPR